MRVLVQSLSVLASAREPVGDGGLPVAEDPPSFGRIQPTSRGQSTPRRPGTRGSFQAVQRSMAPGSERGTASRASQCLDALGMAMLAIPNESMNVSVCDAEVRALVVRTGEAICVYPLGCSPAAFDLGPRADRWSRRLHTRREGRGEATGGAIAWGAWLEKSVDCGVQRHCFRVRKPMTGPVKMTKLRQVEPGRIKSPGGKKKRVISAKLAEQSK